MADYQQLPARLDTLASIVGTCTGVKEFEYKPRFDVETPDIGRIALIAPDREYARWGGAFTDKIPFWDPMRDGEHLIVAVRRINIGLVPAMEESYHTPKDKYGVVTNLIPVYDLDRIALATHFPETIDAEGQVRGYYGSATDEAQAHYLGKYLYGVKLDSGGKVLIAGDSLDSNNSSARKRVHVVAKKSGRIDRISRPIYLAESLVEIKPSPIIESFPDLVG